MKRFYLWFTLALCKFAVLDASAWNVDGNGIWSLATNWNPTNVPGSIGEPTADLGNIITQPRTITIDQNFTITGLTFDNSFSYTLDPSNSSSLTINGAVTVSAGSHVINAPVITATGMAVSTAASTSLDLGGVFSGTGTLTRTGLGQLSLLNLNNTFTGDIDLQSGSILSVASLGGVGTVTLDVSAVFEPLSTFTTTDRNFTFANQGIISVGAGNSFTVSGEVTGGVLIKEGNGTLIFTNNNNGLSSTGIVAGTLSVANADQLALNGGVVSCIVGTTLQLIEDTELTGSLFITPSGPLGTVTIDTGSNTFTHSGAILGTSGAGSLTKTGVGTLVLTNTGNSALNSPLIIEEGVVSVGSGDQLIGEVTLDGGALEATSSLTQNFGLVMGANGGEISTPLPGTTFTQAGAVEGPGSYTKTGSGTLSLTNTSNAAQTDAPLTIAEGVVSVSSGDQLTGEVTLDGGV
ncbi:MAG: hypothetical protein AAGI90_05965, partial [Chlamydiota bacterium]